MSFNLKRVKLVIILSFFIFPLYCAEKSDIYIAKKINSFYSFNSLENINKNNLVFLKSSNNNNINNKINLYTYTGFQSNLYRSGLYMLCFGGASAILGGTLFGLSYLLKWYCANSIGWSYENVVFNLFFLESLFNIHSYYATIAIAFWISGIVLMSLSAMIIPGIILMVIDLGGTAKRIYPIKEAVGFAIKF
jgi:hypothetical protein